MQVGQEYARRVEERELAAMEKRLGEVDADQPVAPAPVVGKKESKKTK